MFTGIIQHKGVVVFHEDDTLVLRVPPRVAARLKQGDSIAVNGVCLSVLKKRGTSLTFDIMEETLRVSNLGGLRVAQTVNLELPLTFGAPLGGHLVQGHVEGVGTIVSLNKVRPRTRFNLVQIWTVQLPLALMRHVKAKGSIALEGISLTVVKKKGTTITVSLLRDTLQRTNLQYKVIGDTLNVETDIYMSSRRAKARRYCA